MIYLTLTEPRGLGRHTMAKRRGSAHDVPNFAHHRYRRYRAAHVSCVSMGGHRRRTNQRTCPTSLRCMPRARIIHLHTNVGV